MVAAEARRRSTGESLTGSGAEVRPQLGWAGESPARHGVEDTVAGLASRFVAPQRLGRADPRAKGLEIAGDPARRPRLDEDVAERRGLDRSGDDRELARIRGEPAQEIVPRPAADQVDGFDAAARQARRIADGGREGRREAVEDAADEGLAGGRGRLTVPLQRRSRSAPACRRAAGTPDRSDRRLDRRPEGLPRRPAGVRGPRVRPPRPRCAWIPAGATAPSRCAGSAPGRRRRARS